MFCIPDTHILFHVDSKKNSQLASPVALPNVNSPNVPSSYPQNDLANLRRFNSRPTFGIDKPL